MSETGILFDQCMSETGILLDQCMLRNWHPMYWTKETKEGKPTTYVVGCSDLVLFFDFSIWPPFMNEIYLF